MVLARHFLLFALLIICVYTDLASGKIYNWCTFPALFVGVLTNYVIGGFTEGGWTGMNLVSSAAGIILVLAVFGWPYLRGGIAAGDVKLMLAVGGIGGMHELYSIYAVFYSVLVGALMAFLLFVWKGRLWQGLKGSFRYAFSTGKVKGENSEDPGETEESENSFTGLTIPYGFAIAVGSVIAWYLVEVPEM
ncbi:MAG: prepilin peptidase [Candidatus Brocadiia bacterium]